MQIINPKYPYLYFFVSMHEIIDFTLMEIRIYRWRKIHALLHTKLNYFGSIARSRLQLQPINGVVKGRLRR
jgi:hypothetical protein